MTSKSILLIISGSIAATKAPDLIRMAKAKDIRVRAILTEGGEQFISREQVKDAGGELYTELFSSDEEIAMAHIHLSRQSDLVVVAPASANIIAKMVQGFADDLASATLLANNKPLLVAPAMNTQMWIHPATQRNIEQIEKDGAFIIQPAEGMLACGEVGQGRMAEPDVILKAIIAELENDKPLSGRRALVTSGPTLEAIDPVRYLGNRSSGKQGHAIARELARAGAEVTLVAGPVALPDPAGVSVQHVMTAEEMLKACETSLPADIVVCAAAVADWRPSMPSVRKLKKNEARDVPELQLIENPDILAHLSAHPKHRPALVVGFAAETESVQENAQKKLKSKGCDWIVANDVAEGKGFSQSDNEVMLITAQKSEAWPQMSKEQIARQLVARIANHFGKKAA